MTLPPDADPFDPETLEGDIARACPGLHDTAYQAIALGAFSRGYDNRAQCLSWALTMAGLELKEQNAKDEAEDKIWQD